MLELGYFFQCLVFVIVLTIYIKDCGASFFNPLTIYLVFHFLVFIVRPFLVVFCGFDHGWWYMRYYPDDYDIIKAFFVSSFGLVVFFGFFVYFSNNIKPDLNMFNVDYKISRVEVFAFIFMSLLVFPIGVYSTISTISGIHSSSVGMEFVDGIRIHTKTTGYLVDAKNMLFSYSIIAIFVFRFKPYSFIFLLLFISHRAFVGYGRWGIILALISLVLLYLYFNRKLWPSRNVLILLPAVFLIFNLIGHNRDVVRGLFEDVEETVNVYDSEGFNSYDTLDFANFDYLTFIVDTIPDETSSYRYGAQYLQLFTEPVPRVLWSGKPLGEPLKFYDLNNHGHFLGLSYSLPGDGWSSGGFLGVFITMMIFAFFIGRFYFNFCKHSNDLNVVMIYFIVYPIFVQLFRDGGISIFKFLLFILIPVFLFNFFKKHIAKRVL